MDVFYLRLPLVRMGVHVMVVDPEDPADLEVRTTSPERSLGCAAVAVGPDHQGLIGRFAVRHPLRGGALVPLVLGRAPVGEPHGSPRPPPSGGGLGAQPPKSTS